MSDKRTRFRDSVAAHLLTNGLGDSGIRSLARAAGTSDRMLIYYFVTKEDLLRQALGLIVANLSAQLDELIGSHRKSRTRLLEELSTACADPAFFPVMQLWFEIVGLAARDVAPYKEVSQEIAREFIAWIEQHLSSKQPGDAADLFAHLEGRVLLRVIGLA